MIKIFLAQINDKVQLAIHGLWSLASSIAFSRKKTLQSKMIRNIEDSFLVFCQKTYSGMLHDFAVCQEIAYFLVIDY